MELCNRNGDTTLLSDNLDAKELAKMEFSVVQRDTDFEWQDGVLEEGEIRDKWEILKNSL